MSGALESRIIKLEQAEEAGTLVYVRTILRDGSIKPLAPGERYGPYVMEAPEVLPVGEWQAKYAPPSV